MFSSTSVLAGLLLAIASFAVAQEPQNTRQTPEDAFSTRQLIAWSSLQKPQPAPQPLPPRDTPIPQPDQPPDQQAKPPADGPTEQLPAESFTGKLVKQGAEYVLRAANNTTYQLDADGDLDRYDNQNVKVTGKLETGTNKIHVLKIELLS